MNAAPRVIFSAAFLLAVSQVPQAVAAAMGSFEEASLALAKTQAFLQQRDSQPPLTRLPSPLESLNHDNMHQLERQAGPMFGRFYDERKLLNNPPEHTARGNAGTDPLPSKTPAVIPSDSPKPATPKTGAAVPPSKNSAPTSVSPGRETGALNFLENAQPDAPVLPIKASGSVVSPIDQKIKSTHTGKGTSPSIPSQNQPAASDPSSKNNLSELTRSKSTRLSSTGTSTPGYAAASVDARAIATPSKRGFHVPQWVKRIQRIDEPVNELQLFIPRL